MTEFLATEPEEPFATLVLAHGAGAPMDSPFMERIAGLLGDRRIRVLRFEFNYMGSRRRTGKRKPASKAESLTGEYRSAIEAARRRAPHPLAIGGKSMGGRVASLIADEHHSATETAPAVCALVCLGYPFHPPGTPEKLRTQHLVPLTCPALIVQGERDPFGNREEVEGYQLSAAIKFCWMADGDHDFGPRGASGHSRTGNLIAAADAVAAFLAPAPKRA